MYKYMTSSTLLPSNAEIQRSRENWRIGKNPVTQWASAWVGRERGVGREVCFEHLLCAEPSVRCRGRMKRCSVVLVLRGLTLQLTLSQVCCLMFICGWVRFLLRRSSLYQLDQESAGQRTRGWLLFIESKSQDPYFCSKRSVYLFIYCRIWKDQLGDGFCILHFFQVNIFSPSVLLIGNPKAFRQNPKHALV